MSYYLQKGYKLEYLLNLSIEERMFFKRSLEVELERKVFYDKEKFKTWIEILSKLLGGIQ